MSLKLEGVCLGEKKPYVSSQKVYPPLMLGIRKPHNKHSRVVLTKFRADDVSESEGQESVPITSYWGRAPQRHDLRCHRHIVVP